MLYKRCPCEDAGKCSHSWWYEFELHGRRYRSSTRTTNARTAARIETKAKTDALEESTGIAKPKIVRLSTHISDYCAHTKAANTTFYKDQAVLDRLQTSIGDRVLDAITGFQIEGWKRDRAKVVSRSTVNRELNIVRGCFSRAVDWGRLAKSPLADVKAFVVDDHRIRVLSDIELRAVLAIPDPFVTLICRLSLESLGRISALLGLHQSHIGASWIETRVKGGQVLRIPVTPELRSTLLGCVHARSGLVFGEGDRGTAPTQQTASKRVITALDAAGVRDASHHTMRHTGVTLMLEQGVNPRVIQKLAGWSSLRMLERYGHARDAEAMRAVRAIATHLTDLPTTAPTADETANSGSPEIVGVNS